MNLSENKLIKLFSPIIETNLATYGIEKVDLDCRLDGTGDEAIYLNITLRMAKGEDYQKNADLTKSQLDNLLYENDDRRYFYCYIRFIEGVKSIDPKERKEEFRQLMAAREKFYAR